MKPGERSSYAISAMTGGPLPPGIRRLALKRAADLMTRGAMYASLPDLLAAAYLLGVEDAADALDREAPDARR